MKKFLLGTVALVALGATVPALAADLGARAPYYAKAPAYVAPIYNWTGFYIGGHLGGAFGGNNTFAGTLNNSNSGSFSAACRAAPTTSSLRTGSLVSKASTAGSATTTTTSYFRTQSTPTTSVALVR